jgi:hypothetical protein
MQTFVCSASHMFYIQMAFLQYEHAWTLSALSLYCTPGTKFLFVQSDAFFCSRSELFRHGFSILSQFWHFYIASHSVVFQVISLSTTSSTDIIPEWLFSCMNCNVGVQLRSGFKYFVAKPAGEFNQIIRFWHCIRIPVDNWWYITAYLILQLIFVSVTSNLQKKNSHHCMHMHAFNEWY